MHKGRKYHNSALRIARFLVFVVTAYTLVGDIGVTLAVSLRFRFTSRSKRAEDKLANRAAAVRFHLPLALVSARTLETIAWTQV